MSYSIQINRFTMICDGVLLTESDLESSQKAFYLRVNCSWWTCLLAEYRVWSVTQSTDDYSTIQCKSCWERSGHEFRNYVDILAYGVFRPFLMDLSREIDKWESLMCFLLIRRRWAMFGLSKPAFWVQSVQIQTELAGAYIDNLGSTTFLENS